MDDHLKNGYSTKYLIDKIVADGRCPPGVRSTLARELPAFNELRRSQTGHMSPGQMLPHCEFLMRVEHELSKPDQSKQSLISIARTEALNLGLRLTSNDLAAIIDIAVSGHKKPR